MHQDARIAYKEGVTALLSLVFCLSATAGLSQQQHFSGAVRTSETYSHDLGRGLVLIVTTSSIEVQSLPGARGGANYAGCVTPPFHGPNALDLQAWQFTSPSQEQFVGPRREFQFALNAADDKADCAELNRVLYGSQTTSTKGAHTGNAPPFRAHPLGSGVVTLSNVQLNHPESTRDAKISSFSFVANITLPPMRKGKH